MADIMRLCVAKNAQFGARGEATGWRLFIEKDNRGITVKQQNCIEETDDLLVFECDVEDLITQIEVLQDCAKDNREGEMMDNEIMECPFCGSADGDWGKHAPDCYARLMNELVFDFDRCKEETHGEDALRKAWETRYKRTCRLTENRNLRGSWPDCSECGGAVQRNSEFCPHCGSEVSDGR